MYADELVVTYWYDVDNSSIIEKHILIDTDNTESELSSETHTGQVGTTETLNRNTYDINFYNNFTDNMYFNINNDVYYIYIWINHINLR